MTARRSPLLLLIVLCMLTAGVTLAIANVADACAVCFGDPSSAMTQGVQTGVWFLLAVVFLIQAGFGIFFVYLRRRAQAFRDPMPRPVFRLVKG